MPSSDSAPSVKPTVQMNTWSGDFGREYTDRSIFSVEELDAIYKEGYGLTRTELNARTLAGVPRDGRVLEVGCNVGNGLRCLQAMGFTNLYGIELQPYAIEKAKALCKGGITILQGSALDLPFKDGFFDLVFTAGVLIHISPRDLPRVMDEIHRCTARYVWGVEYFAETFTALPYRGLEDHLWKGDYAKIYTERFPDLRLVRSDIITHTYDENVDTSFLLEKTGGGDRP